MIKPDAIDNLGRIVECILAAGFLIGQVLLTVSDTSSFVRALR